MAELRAFSECSERLAIALSMDPLSISMKLEASGIIPSEVKQKMTLPNLTNLQKSNELISCVRRQIEINPLNLRKFSELLGEEIHLKDVVKQLEKSYETQLHLRAHEKWDEPLDAQPGIETTTDEITANEVLDIRTMQVKFAAVVGKTLNSLEGRIQPQVLAQTVLSLGAYEPVKTSEDLLLEDRENEIKCANSNSGIFDIIRSYMSFFNPEVLGAIIEAFGTSDDKSAYSRYIQVLEAFCKSIVVSTDNPCNLSGGRDDISKKHEMIVKIRIDLNDKRLQRIREVKPSIARILRVNVIALQVVGASEGSLEVVFLVHNVVIKQLYLLSDIQKRLLQDLGVLSVEFQNQTYDLRLQQVNASYHEVLGIIRSRHMFRHLKGYLFQVYSGICIIGLLFLLCLFVTYLTTIVNPTSQEREMRIQRDLDQPDRGNNNYFAKLNFQLLVGFIIPAMINVVVELILRSISYRARQKIWNRSECPITLWLLFTWLFNIFYACSDFKAAINDEHSFTLTKSDWFEIIITVFVACGIVVLLAVIIFFIVERYARVINLPASITRSRELLTFSIMSTSLALLYWQQQAHTGHGSSDYHHKFEMFEIFINALNSILCYAMCKDIWEECLKYFTTFGNCVKLVMICMMILGLLNYFSGTAISICFYYGVIFR